MLTRQKSIKSRTRALAASKTNSLPPISCCLRGKLRRFVSGPDDPLRASRTSPRGVRADGGRHDAEVRQFLQRPISSRSSFGDDSAISNAFRSTRSGSRRADEAEGPVDLEVGPLLDHAGGHDGHAPSRRQVCRDPRRIAAGPGGGQRSRRPHPGAGRDRCRVRSDAGTEARRCASFRQVAVAETAAAGRRTRRDDASSPRKIGESRDADQTSSQATAPASFLHPSLPNMFAGTRKS